MINPSTTTSPNAEPRVGRLLARLRHRQLELAQQGRVIESGAYADRVQRLRRYLDDESGNTLAEMYQ
jgi:hypothetical protein